MSKPPKIKLEKKVFKIGNNETFLLEYPSNYEEIANKKLYNLQKDYESTSNSNNDRNKIKINNNEKNEENYYKEKNETKNNTNNSNIINNKDYYQPIDKIEVFSYDDEINSNNKNDNDNNANQANNISLEPKEGFIEIQKVKKDIKKENESVEEEINEEFYEVEEKEIEDNNKKEKQKENKKQFSPIKNAENVKNAMKLLNFKAPKWAENMTDKDFINMAKKLISSKKDN